MSFNLQAGGLYRLKRRSQGINLVISGICCPVSRGTVAVAPAESVSIRRSAIEWVSLSRQDYADEVGVLPEQRDKIQDAPRLDISKL